MKLQIAFDFIDLDQGLRIAVETSPPADWLEVGTSLIKSAGIVEVRRFKEGFPKKEIVADMKTWKSKTGSAVVTARVLAASCWAPTVTCRSAGRLLW